ncbi:acyl-CoA dehydrogenase family protein [Pseudonocardia yunnanensis]|uniref:Acyl-CoA dehydrogenase family protein n=1 Tax=Pseudonocardia yunnanensis TaxID=58107 RepID=A0ABW4F959_9PSEU
MNGPSPSVPAECTSSAGELLDRARALVPLLRANAAETERLGTLPDDNVTALRDAGFFTLGTPHCFGGPEADFRTWVDVIAELARGCGSSAWVATLLSMGSHFTALLGDRARSDVWAAGPHATICMNPNPSAGGRAVDGGMVVSGRWRPMSGCNHAQWVMGGVPVHDGQGAVVDRKLVLVPMNQTRIEETWNVAGMRGTGSNTVVVDEVFVPEHRILSLPRALAGDYAAEHPDEPQNAISASSLVAVAQAAPALGLATAALEHTLDVLGAGRAVGTSIYQNAINAPSVQFNVADAARLIDTARMHTDRAVADMNQGVRERHPLDLATRARIRMDVGTVMRSTQRAVGLLLDVGGAGGFDLANPVQRIWRDLETVARHQILSPDLSREIYGRALLGVEPQVSNLI